MQSKPAVIEKINVGDEKDYIYRAYKQLKLSGSILELKKFENSFTLFFPKSLKRFKEKEKRVYTEEEIQKRSYRRAKTKIIEYVNSNDGFHHSETGRAYRSVFVTLTIAENISDINITNPWFTKFIVNFSKFFEGTDLKYLAVPEFQKRGAVHYHCIFFNLPYRTDIKNVLIDCWPYGFSQIKSLERVRNVGKYISKYLSKSLNARGYVYKKSYFASRDLLKPIKTNFDEIITQVMEVVPESALEYETTNIPTDFLGTMDYQVYNLKDFPIVLDVVKGFLNY